MEDGEFLKNNIANFITSVRILFSFLFIYLASKDQRMAFLVLYLILYLSDIIDGNLARKLNIVSEKGRKLDAVADYIFHSLTVLCFVYIFKQDIFDNLIFFLIPILNFFIPKIFHLFVFKKYPIVRMKGWFYTSYALVLFLVISLGFGFNRFLLFFLILFSFFGLIEETITYVKKYNYLTSKKVN